MCGQKPDYRGLQIHEIERRGQTGKSFHPCNYLLPCAPCHEGPLATMPHAQQLAYKQLRDLDNYNLTEWLRLRDPELLAPNRVTQQEVDLWLDSIKWTGSNSRRT